MMVLVVKAVYKLLGNTHEYSLVAFNTGTVSAPYIVLLQGVKTLFQRCLKQPQWVGCFQQPGGPKIDPKQSRALPLRPQKEDPQIFGTCQFNLGNEQRSEAAKRQKKRELASSSPEAAVRPQPEKPEAH